MFLADLIRFTHEVTAKVKDKHSYKLHPLCCTGLASNISRELFVHMKNNKYFVEVSVSDLICILKKEDMTGVPQAF